MYSHKHLHFVGIGGIGMSGLAKIMRQKGFTVSGCDTSLNSNTKELISLGCTVADHHLSENCNDPSIDLVIHSSAITKNHPELTAAYKKRIVVIHRSLLLAELTRTHYSICVTGSHGKTTTTSLITHIMQEAGRNTTYLIGGNLLKKFSNAHLGSDSFLITEADESDRSLLNLFPTVAVVTNSDYEHVDTYQNSHDVTTMFNDFIKKIPFYGKAILCMDSIPLRHLIPLTHGSVITYGAHHQESFKKKLTWSYANVTLNNHTTSYDLYHQGTFSSTITLPLAGIHNVANSVAAYASCFEAGIDPDTIKAALANFAGVDRRFTFKGLFKETKIFDDYGHHPEEIKHTLAVARQATKGRLTVIFQPHRYTRTATLWHEFIDTFLEIPLDELIITDIYAANETPIEGITAQTLVAALKERNPHYPVLYLPLEENFCSLTTHITTSPPKPGLLLLQGAGKLNYLPELILKQAP